MLNACLAGWLAEAISLHSLAMHVYSPAVALLVVPIFFGLRMWGKRRQRRGLAAICFRGGFQIFRILGPNFGPILGTFSHPFWYPKSVPNPRILIRSV